MARHLLGGSRNRADCSWNDGVERKGVAVAKTGLTTVLSKLGLTETTARLNAAIGAAGMTVFARIDHGAAAAAVNLKLMPIELVIFGSAKGGTRLMAGSPTIGIDLPLKILLFQVASAGTRESDRARS
jgi:uncharacterized protein (DUF302 family)